MAIKDDGSLTFGQILQRVAGILPDERTKELCREVKLARDTVAAHFYFVAFLDPTNRTKRAFYDVNNYRKLIRRMYKLVKGSGRIDLVEDFLNRGSPLVRLARVQRDGFICEKMILQRLCEQTRNNVINIVRMTLPSSTGPAGYATKIDQFLV